MNVSLIIPTYNGESTLRELFAVLHYQTLQPDETLVVDSTSTDKSVDVCTSHGADVTVIPQNSFDHGGTRTMLAQRAVGEFLLFFTQDAIPTTRDAVERLIQPMVDDPAVACTYGRQLPDKNAGFPAAHLRGFNYPPESTVRRYADRDQLGIRTIFTSNSFAAYRRSALEEVGYFKNGLIFGEDTCTVGRLLQAGYAIAYVADATVYHSHDYSLDEEFRRSFDIGVLHISECELFEDFGNAESRGREYVKSGLQELWKRKRYAELADFAARTLIKYAGYKLGRNYAMLPSALVPELSMHKSWWKKVSSR